MIKKNILVIDDSALMRRVLSDIINSDERFCVKDLAINGLEGLELLTRRTAEYAAVLLDINMPKLNGLEMLEMVNKSGIKVPIIIVSTLAKEGAKETIRALELGAFDFVTKPDSFLEVRKDDFKENILKMLEAATGAKVSVRTETVTKSPMNMTPVKAVKHGTGIRKGGRKLVALACSTGGPKALQSVVPKLPGNLDASVLIVQHMPEGFTLSLANRLDEMSMIRVKEVEDGDMLQKGQVYLAKGGYQMRLEQSVGNSYLTLKKDPPRGGLRPCADIMYESLVGTDYDQIICVVLTGMGGDGTQGIKQLNDNTNIYVIAQDEATSVVYGMPKVIADSGLVDEVLPLEEIADAITRAVGVR